MTIKTNNLSDQNIYIRSVKLNGKPYNKVYFKHEDLMKGVEIVFEMGSEPCKNWGIEKTGFPPSMNDELK